MALENVHYTWIGPPSFDARDTGGPNALMRASSTGGAPGYVINYWCLDKYENDYRSFFKPSNFRVLNREKIEVRSIEGFLERNVGVRRGSRSAPLQTGLNWVWSNFSWDVDLVVKTIIGTSTASSSPATRVREIVNAKNVWSLYLLFKEGGYAMDTGVGPGADNTVSLRSYDTFKAPGDVSPRSGEIEDGVAVAHARASHRYLSQQCSAMTAGVADHFSIAREVPAPHVDVWTLYSPAGDARVKRALEWYIRFWHVLETVRTSSASTDEYKDLCRHGIISAVMTALMHNVDGTCRDDTDRNGLWPAALSGADAGVPELKIRKTYYGSHR